MAEDTSDNPAGQHTKERPVIQPPLAFAGRRAGHRVCWHRLAVRPAAGRGLCRRSAAGRSDLGGSGCALGIRPACGLVLIALALFYAAMVAVRASPACSAEHAHGFRAGAADRRDLPPRPPGEDEPDRLRYRSRDERSGAGLPTLLAPLRDLPRVERTPGKRRRLAPVLWGVALALPLLLVFGALFAAADAVFANFLQGMFAWVQDYPQLLARLILSLILSWLALGLARRAFTARKTPPKLEDYANLDFLHLGAPTAITALALVDLLFLGFVLVQAVYCSAAATRWHARASPTASTPAAVFSSW